MQKAYLATYLGTTGDWEENIQYITDTMQTVAELTGDRIIPISPVNMWNSIYNTVSYDIGMQYCLELLLTCDILVLCREDWQRSKGMSIEVEFAKQYNIPILTLSSLLKLYSKGGSYAD
jgi:hypothetical protein